MLLILAHRMHFSVLSLGLAHEALSPGEYCWFVLSQCKYAF